MTIKFYQTKAEYGFLNNFYRAKMEIYGKIWDTVEHAYQAQKTAIPGEINKIWAAATPREARNMGQLVQMRPDWDQVKYSVMKECVMAKFLQHSDLKIKLIDTAYEEIVEDSPIDWYWGCGKDGTGQNMLGKILMEVRHEI
jgi:ribA/ribD-fused uncharacterized protein